MEAVADPVPTVRLSGWELFAVGAPGLKISTLVVPLNIPFPVNTTLSPTVLHLTVPTVPVVAVPQKRLVVGTGVDRGAERNSPPLLIPNATAVVALFTLAALLNLFFIRIVRICCSLVLAAGVPQFVTVVTDWLDEFTGINCTPINVKLSWPALSPTLSLAVAPVAFWILYIRLLVPEYTVAGLMLIA